MKRRRLGDSELEVSEISLGSWLTYSGGVEREHTEACTRAAFEADINFFDTANVYGNGAAEEAWGEILSGYDRESFVLATKVFFEMSDTDSRALAGADPQADRRLPRAPANGLRRPLPVPPLRSRRPDRGDDGGADRGGRGRQGALPRLQRVVARADPRRARRRGSGEVRLLAAAVQHDLARPRGRGLPALRRQWDLADRLVAAGPGSAHRQVRARRAAGVGLARGEQGDGLGDGPLSRRPRARGGAAAAPDRRRGGPDDGRSSALAWVLRRDEVASAIVGASRPEQVRENAAASGVELSPDTLAAIDDALDGIAVTESQSASAPGITHRLGGGAYARPAGRASAPGGLSWIRRERGPA